MSGDYKLQRRVAGGHNLRMDGISDLLSRARGKSVMDIGCNRGMAGYDFALNGATVVHGCDNYEDGIKTAREVFMDMRGVEGQFEIVDLTKGPEAFAPFGDRGYDFVLMLATYHKLRRSMSAERLSTLIKYISRRCLKYFAWRGTRDGLGNDDELRDLDRDLKSDNLLRVHTSNLESGIGPAAIWERK